MTRTLKTLGAAVLFAATASIAGAAPATMGHTPEGLSNDVIQVHGNHQSCSAGPAAGIATTGLANGALVASGAAKVADLTPVSELDQSGTAITDRRRPICPVASLRNNLRRSVNYLNRSNAVASGGLLQPLHLPRQHLLQQMPMAMRLIFRAVTH